MRGPRAGTGREGWVRSLHLLIHLFIHQGALWDKQGGDQVTEGPVGQGRGLVASVTGTYSWCSLGQGC